MASYISSFCKISLIACIRIYRFAISLLLGHCCRFEPTCSAYAMTAIQLHGSIKGCGLSLRRLLRCHPWHPGGIDPVPEVQASEGKSNNF